MSLEQILEKSESKVLTEEVIKNIQEHMDSKINEKASILSTDMFNQKEKEYETSLEEMLSTVSDTIKEELKEKYELDLKEKLEKEVSELQEKFQKDFDDSLKKELDKLEERSKTFLTHSVEDFVKEAIPVWESEIKVKKAEQLSEDFKALTEAYGFKLDLKSEDEKLTESKDKINKMLENEKELNKKILDLEKDKIVEEAMKDLDSVKKDNLKNLLEKEDLDELTLESFKTKLELYKSALSSVTNETKETKDKETNEAYIPEWKKKLQK